MMKTNKKNAYQILSKRILAKNTDNPFGIKDMIEEWAVRLPDGKVVKTRVVRVVGEDEK